MPVNFSEADFKRVRENGARNRRKGSVEEAISMWHEFIGQREFHLFEMRGWLWGRGRVFIKGSEQKALMRMHRLGEVNLDMDVTNVRKRIYRFKG